MYPRVHQFTARYEKFLSEVVFQRECQLSPAALAIYDRLSKQCHGNVTKTETEKELSAFAHNSSKVFHHLGHHLPRGLDCGGDPPTMTAIAILILLLQQRDCLSDDVNIVDMNNKRMMVAKDGVLENKGDL